MPDAKDEKPKTDPLEQIKAADAEIREHQTAIREAQVAEVIDTDAEVRESQLKMSAAMGKEAERHQKVLDQAQEKKLRALQSIDTTRYWANTWGKGDRQIIYYQCAYCPVDFQSETVMQEHQFDAHPQTDDELGPPMRDRFGVLIEREG